MRTTLAILLLACGWAYGDIAFTDIPDSTVYQYPHTGRTPGTFPVISGTYTGSPTAISAKVLDFDADTIIKDWTVIDASPSGNSFSETLTDIPRGGPFRLVVKTDLINDTLRGSNKWGVGECIGVFGQSNILNRALGDPVNTVNGFSVKYVAGIPYKLNDNWQLSTPIAGYTSILPSCSNKILLDINNAYPIAFCGYALGGTPMVTANETGKWNSRNAADPDDLTTLYGMLLSRIINYKPNTIIMYQGEADAGVKKSTASYVSAAQNMFFGLATDLGYTPVICIVQIREEYDLTTTDTNYWNIEKAQRDLANDSTILLAACTYDLPTTGDGPHISKSSQNICGRRLGHTIARIFKDSIDEGYRFKIDSASAIERGVVRLYTERVLGNTIINSPLSRMEYLTATLESKPVVASWVTGDTCIDFRITDRIMADSSFFSYDKYHTTTVSTDSIIYDSDSLPLEPER